ncbi:hypothetical protein F4781DRAFT_334164 [Annulohypoxylon bovei var. microspora]|nr:hypothetical protein F4781DRAFT_334164 [Annulohypoxylon bovei var. microspora]
MAANQVTFAGAMAMMDRQTSELRIIILTKLPLEVAERVLATMPQLARFLLGNFPRFVRHIFNEKKMPYNLEMLNILCRIVSIEASGTRPFEASNDGPKQYANWIKAFIQRRDGTYPPQIPGIMRTLQYIRRLLGSVQFWMRRFQFDRSKTYELGSYADTKKSIIYEDKDHDDEQSFDEVESYRIRRSLLMFQLYCTLFQFSNRRTVTFFNGRVSEQMLFLQSLQPFLLAELDAVYGMIECHVAGNWHIATSICRKATPLQPGQNAVPGGQKLEYIMSLGLPSIERELKRDVFDAGFDSTDQAAMDDYKCVCEEHDNSSVGNRFFTTPMAYYFARSQNEDSILIPSMVPLGMGLWNDAPDGTNGPSWLSRTFADTSSADYGRITTLIDNDPRNWNGLAFWEEHRVNRHFELLESDSTVNEAFSIADHDTNPKPPGHRQFFEDFDYPDVGYESVILPRSSIMTYKLILEV